MKGTIPMLFAAWMAVLLSGCVKDDLHNTPHPDKGAVEVTTDWTGRSSDAIVPESYVLRIGDKEQQVSGKTNAFKDLFLPGAQNLLVYNVPSGITVSGSIATVNTQPNGTLEPMPDDLFSAAQELNLLKDDSLRVTVAMRQLTRKLTLMLKLSESDAARIASTDATLTGIAGNMELKSGVQTSGQSGKSIKPQFELVEVSTSRATTVKALTATLRMVGVVDGEQQLLTLIVTQKDDREQTIVTDLTDMLKNFSGEAEPLLLDAALVLPEDPTEAGASGTITPWEVVDNGDITIH